MFRIDFIPPSADKSAAQIPLDDRRQCAELMARIYKEDPSYWPHGLNIEGHNGVYLVRKAASLEPVGFTGWQERDENGRRIGYYSIGILKEHRGHGLAKEAVSQLLQQKAAGVDEVRAFIVPHNGPSHRLAAALQIPVVHE